MLRTINFTRRLSTKAPKVPIHQAPKPIALGNSKDQRDFENTIKKAAVKTTTTSTPNTNNSNVQENISEKKETPVVAEYRYERFENDVNPVTKEFGGPLGPEPTRYGDWERKGRISDF